MRLRGVLFLLVAGLAAGPVAAEPERKEKEAELQALRQRIEALRQELASERDRYDDVRQALRQVEERIGAVSRRLRELAQEVADYRQRLEALAAEQAELQQRVERQRGYLGRQVRAAYAAGRQELVKLLLNQEDPASIGRVMAYYDYLNRARSRRIAALERDLGALEAVRERIAEEKAGLEAARAEQLKKKEALEAGRAERARVVSKLESRLANKDQRLNALLQDERELEELVEALRRALADIPAEVGRPFAERRGELAWPVSGPMVARYGTRRGVGSLRWQGVVIGAEAGKEVRAVSHGRVAFAEWMRGYGMLLIVDHGDGFMSLYGHNRSLLKEAGDWVQPGEPLAIVGSSGGRSRDGLYFEIRKGGRPVNPAHWCR